MRHSDIIRKIEKYLFHGVTESPETTFERDDYSHVSERITGRSVNATVRGMSFADCTIIGSIHDDPATGEEVFVKANDQT